MPESPTDRPVPDNLLKEGTRREIMVGRGRAILNWKEREIMVGRVREGKDVIWRSRNGKKRGKNCE